MPIESAISEMGEDTEGSDRGAIIGTSRWQKVVGVAGLLVVVWVGSEMYDVVFFNGTFPGVGQHTPVENQNPGGDPTPPTTGPHDPSQFGH